MLRRLIEKMLIQLLIGEDNEQKVKSLDQVLRVFLSYVFVPFFFKQSKTSRAGSIFTLRPFKGFSLTVARCSSTVARQHCFTSKSAGLLEETRQGEGNLSAHVQHFENVAEGK